MGREPNVIKTVKMVLRGALNQEYGVAQSRVRDLIIELAHTRIEMEYAQDPHKKQATKERVSAEHKAHAKALEEDILARLKRLKLREQSQLISQFPMLAELVTRHVQNTPPV